MRILFSFNSKWEYTKLLSIIKLFPNSSTLYIQDDNSFDFHIESNHHILIKPSNTKNIKNSVLLSISENDDILDLYDYIIIVGHSPVSIAIALTCSHLNKKIIHIDAGSSNTIISKLAYLHFCSSIDHFNSLTLENTNGNIFVTGSTIIDTVKQIIQPNQSEQCVLIHLENTNSNEEYWFTAINQITELFPDFRFILCYRSNELQPYLYRLPSISMVQSIEFIELVQTVSYCSLVISDNDALLETCSFLQKKIIRCFPDSTLRYIDPNCFLCNSLDALPNTVSQVIYLNPSPSNKFLYGDGSSIHKIFTILSNIANPIDLKLLSISNYRMLQPIQNQFAFVITSRVMNSKHNYLLLESIRHIRIIYPQHTIYLIDDQSMYSLKDNPEILSFHVNVIESIVKGGGEINPYLFSLDPRCKHETLVFLHDSAFLKSPIDPFIVSSKHSFLPIWYSKKFIWDDVFDPINTPIRTSMLFYFDDCTTSITLQELLLYFKSNPKLQFVVTFSAMSVFHRSFVQFIQKYTNFFSITHLFTCRKNRCLFERILTSIYFWMYHSSYNTSVCGDINDHPICFYNTNVYINNYHNVFLKVWQGR